VVENWGQLEAFAAVVEARGFSAAARRLGRTTSSLSRQVRALEDRLGVRLLDRTTRRVSPTAAGRAFHERARSILAELAEAEAAVTHLEAEPRGRLRLSAPLDFGRLHLAGPLAGFAARHPGVSLDVELTDRFVDLVEEGFDVVVRIAQLADSSLHARRIAPCRRVLCASPGYLERLGRPAGVADLAGHERIAYVPSGSERWHFRSAGGPRAIGVPERHRANNGELMRALAVAGQGIALLPTFIACDDLRAGRLVALFTDELDEDLAIHAVYPHRRHLSARVRLLVDHLVEELGPEPGWDQGWSREASPPSAGARRSRGRRRGSR